eukprot:SAG31_NODE_29316_length_397_cov_0.694631_2_plen_34_part_01
MIVLFGTFLQIHTSTCEAFGCGGRTWLGTGAAVM